MGDISNPHVLLSSLIIWIWAETFFRLFLNLRQSRTIDQTVNVPRELQMYLSEETFHGSIADAKKKLAFSNIQVLYKGIVYTVFYAYDCTFRIWEFSKNLSSGQHLRSVCFISFIVALNSTKDLILYLPYSWVYGWDLPSFQKFLKEWLKNSMLDLVHYILVAFLISYDDEDWEQNLCLTVAILLCAYKIGLFMLYDQILRLEERTPLPEGELKDKIFQMAQMMNYPLEDILYLQNCEGYEGSAGWGTGVMALSGVLAVYYREEQGGGHAKTLDVQEVLGLVAHELAHWRYNHRFKLVLLQLFFILIRILASWMVIKGFLVYLAFGFQEERPPIVGAFTSFVCVGYPVKVILDSFERSCSRSMEFGADAFGRALVSGRVLRTALTKMSSRSGSYPVFDELYSQFTFSQPTPLERIRVLYAPLQYRIHWRYNAR